jgi:hypothetical protein
MANDRTITKLTKCIKDCNGAAACEQACEDAFVAEGGTIAVPAEGGKVFTGGEGGKVFITTGGKVF